MPRHPKPYVASCEHPGCHESKRFAGEFANPREHLEGEGWYAGARGGGQVAWYCPEHVPKGNPKSVGHSTPCAPCRWVHGRTTAADTSPSRHPIVCANCGNRGTWEDDKPDACEVLDDYAATVARFAARARD